MRACVRACCSPSSFFLGCRGLCAPLCGILGPWGSLDPFSEGDVAFPAHPFPLALDQPGAPAGLQTMSLPPCCVCQCPGCVRGSVCGVSVLSRCPSPRAQPWSPVRGTGLVLLIFASLGGPGLPLRQGVHVACLVPAAWCPAAALLSYPSSSRGGGLCAALWTWGHSPP